MVTAQTKCDYYMDFEKRKMKDSSYSNIQHDPIDPILYRVVLDSIPPCRFLGLFACCRIFLLYSS